MIDGRKVIYGFESPQNSGCNMYRIRNPVCKIMEKDLYPANVTSNLPIPEDKDAWFENTDILITQMAKIPQLLQHIIDCKKNGVNKKFVIDYDDNLFAVSPYNPSYLFHGVDEVDITAEDGTKIEIRDGKNGFNIEENKKNLTTFGLCLKHADMVISPSPVLSGFYKRFNKNTAVIKNFLDLRIWKPIEMVKTDRVRILWQGGWSHFGDMKEIEDALIFVMNKYENVDLVIMGTCFDGVIKSLPKGRVILEDWVDILAYPYKLKTLNADIGIAPLENTEFNTCKSELKWEEYSSLEIPCVASNIPPYSLNIRDGSTGFLCSSAKEWIEVLSKLVESKDLRKKIGKQARKTIEDHYDLDKEIVQYKEAFDSLYQKELILV